MKHINEFKVPIGQIRRMVESGELDWTEDQILDYNTKRVAKREIEQAKLRKERGLEKKNRRSTPKHRVSNSNRCYKFKDKCGKYRGCCGLCNAVPLKPGLTTTATPVAKLNKCPLGYWERDD